MANEILAIPEEHLAEVVSVIRCALKEAPYLPDVSDEVIELLTAWCNEAEEYLLRFAQGDTHGQPRTGNKNISATK